MDDRLQAIETRAKALKWALDEMPDGSRLRTASLNLHFLHTDRGLAAAERLLACYEPGGMMRFYLKDVQGLGPKMMIDYDKSSIPDEPGDYKLVKVR